MRMVLLQNNVQCSENKSGFTTAELAAVITTLLMLGSLLAPSIYKAREAARNAQCKNNMKQYGISMLLFAENDPRQRLCSGAFNVQDDGPIERFGWVADMVNSGFGHPSKMLCPNQKNVLLDTQDYLLKLEKMDTSHIPPELSYRYELETFSTMLSDTKPGTEARADYILKNYIDKGFNTNYATSWYLTRTFCKLDEDKVPEKHAKDLRGTLGPLALRIMDQSDVPASNIPLLGDSKPFQPQKVSKLAVGEFKSGTAFAPNSNSGPVMLDTNKWELVSLDDATAQKKNFVSDVVKTKLPSPNDATVANYQHSKDNADAYQELYGGGGTLWMQDTRSWGAVHSRTGGEKSGNILCADGSVKTIYDVDKDGYFNPGFPMSHKSNPKNPVFKTNACEMPPYLIYSGASIISLRKLKAKFE